MSSLFRSAVIAVVLVAAAGFCQAKPLVFCADPANTPFSNQQGTGFENRIASLLAHQLGTTAEFHWSRMGRGFVRNVLNEGECDALVGVPTGMRGLLETRPYYRSAYVFVTRAGMPPISSFDDPRLRSMRIGVHILEEDYAPPARALARRGLPKNVVGFDMDQDPGQIIRAVAEKKVDVAVVWGPIAGFYAAQLAKRTGRTLKLTPVTPALDPPALPFAYSISIGVRKDAPELREKLQTALDQAEPKIQRILHEYSVPLLALNTGEDSRETQ